MTFKNENGLKLIKNYGSIAKKNINILVLSNQSISFFFLIEFRTCLTYMHTYISVSQIAAIFQKFIFEGCTLYHIMPFAKI